MSQERAMELPEAAENVIDLANRVKKYWDEELPKKHPSYPIIKPGEEPVKPPPQEKELQKLLTELPTNTIYELGLLMSLGKGEVETTELGDYLQTIKKHFEKPKLLARYMAESIPLGTYLSDGLSVLKKNRVDLAKVFARRNGPAKKRRQKK
jgi:hypothetical protein